MDEVLHGLYEFLVAYLDDILIHSATWAELVHHLTQVFDRLGGGYTISPRNLNFFVPVITFPPFLLCK